MSLAFLTRRLSHGAAFRPSTDQWDNKMSETIPQTLMQTPKDMLSFGRANAAAMVKAGNTWATGCQAMFTTAAAATHAQLGYSVTTWTALCRAESLQEAMKLQTEFQLKTFETAVSETTRMTDASMKLAEHAMAPIKERVTLTVEHFSHAGENLAKSAAAPLNGVAHPG